MDVQGILGVDSDVRNGFDGIKVTYNIDADASQEDIIDMLENENYQGFGDHYLQISVDVNKGSCIDPFRETNDDGEEVSYLWELISLDYTITMV